MQLNKYLANSGICSRRKADIIIKSGLVTVNNNIVKESYFKVSDTDIVKYNNKTVKIEKKIYIILNKPKNYITTVKDEQNRRTVLDLLKPKIKERVYPIGRLDYDTTGLLLITNDGDFAQRLAHPSKLVKKTYIATLDKPLNKIDFEKIKLGIKLYDGFIKPDLIEYLKKDSNIIKIAIHSGKNRILKRIFKNFGYKVKKLDRIEYGPLSKKGLSRGQWRYLTKKEIKSLI